SNSSWITPSGTPRVYPAPGPARIHVTRASPARYRPARRSPRSAAAACRPRLVRSREVAHMRGNPVRRALVASSVLAMLAVPAAVQAAPHGGGGGGCIVSAGVTITGTTVIGTAGDDSIDCRASR